MSVVFFTAGNDCIGCVMYVQFSVTCAIKLEIETSLNLSRRRGGWWGKHFIILHTCCGSNSNPVLKDFHLCIAHSLRGGEVKHPGKEVNRNWCFNRFYSRFALFIILYFSENDGMKDKHKERIIHAITFNCESTRYGQLKENTSLKLYLSDSSVQILAIPLL